MKINPEAFQRDRISDYLYRHAADIPDKEAVCSSSESVSYAELLKKVEACAKGLLALGIKKGDRVATLSPPHPDYLVIFLATTAVGGIWVGLNPRYTRDELKHVLSDAEPGLLFARPRIGKRDYREDLQRLRETVAGIKRVVTLGNHSDYPEAVAYEDFLAASSAVSDERLQQRRSEVTSMDAALLVYTSGTTGRPKGAILHHYGAIRQSHVQRSLRLDGEVRQINAYPINHIASVIAGSTYCLVVGGANCLLEKYDPEPVLRIIEEKQITVWGGVPVMLQSVLEHPGFAGADLSSVNEVSYSGGPMTKDLLQRIVNEICPRVTTMYALTEAAGAATAIPSTDDIDLLAVSVGKPISDCEFRLVDETGHVVEQGKEGEIQLRGPFIMKGYWRQPEATRAAMDEEGWLHTKDLAVERKDGNIILLGRLSDMYKSGGYNIYPREIEQALEAHPAINLACVVGVPDPVYQEVGYAFVTLTPGQGVDEAIIREHCRTRLANYKIPKYISLEQTLPVMPSNKPDKRKLKEIARTNTQNIRQTSISTN